jgi:hypothetical protein
MLQMFSDVCFDVVFIVSAERVVFIDLILVVLKKTVNNHAIPLHFRSKTEHGDRYCRRIEPLC